MTERARWSALVLAFGSTLLSSSALGNGRFPNAQQLREPSPDAMLVAATYGLLSTTNSGRDFAWVCETELFGDSPGGSTLDPLLELAPDGSFLTGSVHRVRASRDRGCAFETVSSLPQNPAFFGRPQSAVPGKVIDLCRRGAGADAPVLALIALVDDDGFALEHRLYQAHDGFAFEPIGAPVPLSILHLAFTLDVAPSDPNRIYVSGSIENDPLLATSDDGGATWQAKSIAIDDAEFALGAYVAAVAPNDPARLYLRIPRRKDSTDGLYTWDDSLLTSSDGGSSWADVLRRQANLLGFALSSDGATVLAGYGDPQVLMIQTVPSDFGIYRGDAGDLGFEQIVSDLDVSCLHWSATGLYVCASERDPLGLSPELAPDFHLGVYRGPGLPRSRADFSPLLKLKDVRGPPPRRDGMPAACGAEWRLAPEAAPADMCFQFNACANAAPEPDSGALVCGNDDALAGRGADSSGGSASVEASPAGGGCACEAPKGPRSADPYLALLVAGALCWCRRSYGTRRA